MQFLLPGGVGKWTLKLCSSAQLDLEETSIPENLNYFTTFFQTSRVGKYIPFNTSQPSMGELQIDPHHISLKQRLSENNCNSSCRKLIAIPQCSLFRRILNKFSWVHCRDLWVWGLVPARPMIVKQSAGAEGDLTSQSKEIWWMYTSVHNDMIWNDLWLDPKFEILQRKWNVRLGSKCMYLFP